VAGNELAIVLVKYGSGTPISGPLVEQGKTDQILKQMINQKRERGSKVI